MKRIVDGNLLRAAAQGFRALFFESLESQKTHWEQLAMRVDSDSPEETYNWLAGHGQMREWIGDRVIRGLAAHGYTIKKKDWEYTIGVKRDELEFDKLGLVKPRIQSMANLAGSHRDQLIVDLLTGGFAGVCYDGQYFFDTDHPVADGVQSNRGTRALSVEAYDEAYTAMQTLMNDEGEPLELIPTHLVVPPQLRSTAMKILKSDKIDNMANPHQNSAELLVLPRLAKNPKAWYLLDLSRPLKPFVMQIVKDYDFVALESPTDENVFMRKEFLYGVDCMDNAGYGLWQLAWGSTGESA